MPPRSRSVPTAPDAIRCCGQWTRSGPCRCRRLRRFRPARARSEPVTRRLMLTVLFLVVAAIPALAHDDYRIIGTIVKVDANRIDVKQTRDKKVVSMLMETSTLVTRDKKKAARTELKVGANVVVDARGDDIDDLSVVEIKLVPALAK